MADSFAQWFTKQFIRWQALDGKRKTLQELAEHFGVSHSAISLWMSGEKIPSRESANQIASKFGIEALILLRYLPDNLDPDLEYILTKWEVISKDQRKEIVKAIREKLLKDELIREKIQMDVEMDNAAKFEYDPELEIWREREDE
jgi:transcriptional regulator with XRE-family HTH domain